MTHLFYLVENTGASEIMQHADELQVGGQSPGRKKF
jgi:hypothetical protein